MIGVRIASVDAYLCSLTPAQVRHASQAIVGAKAVAPVLLDAESDEARDLLSTPHQDLQAAMAWARQQQGGWDLAFPLLTLDRPIDALVEAAEQYRVAATTAST